MRKLLVLLSVVLVFALYQARPTTNIHASFSHKFRPLDCTFGYKKVNGTKRCKTMEEFFHHPRNETNCTRFKVLKCYNYKNASACLCVRKPIKPPHHDFPHPCPPGFTWRCTRGLNKDCQCRRIGPIKINDTTRIPNCSYGKYLSCTNTKCICKPLKKISDIEPFQPSLPEPLNPIEPLENEMPLV